MFQPLREARGRPTTARSFGRGTFVSRESADPWPASAHINPEVIVVIFRVAVWRVASDRNLIADGWFFRFAGGLEDEFDSARRVARGYGSRQNANNLPFASGILRAFGPFSKIR
jgi:hypothetical protein